MSPPPRNAVAMDKVPTPTNAWNLIAACVREAHTGHAQLPLDRWWIEAAGAITSPL